MRLRTLVACGLVYLGALTAGATATLFRFSLDRGAPPNDTSVVTEWVDGVPRHRRLVSSEDVPTLLRDSANPEGLVVEDVVDTAPVLGRSRLLFGASFAPAKDGVRVAHRDRIAILTPDELQRLHAYDAEFPLGRATLRLGVHRDLVVGSLAATLQVSEDELLAHGDFERVALRRRHPPARPEPSLGREQLRRAVELAGRYLAGQLKPNGTFRYEVDPFRGQLSPGYSWPRHAGATFFLAQAAALAGDSRLYQKARAAAQAMTGKVSRRCGEHRCIGDEREVNIGSSALAVLAFVELVQGGIAPEFRPVAVELAAFLRSQQRADGEFMHLFDLASGRPEDVQRAYYTGEAAFALARIHRITQDPRDLEAARRALEYLVYRPFWAPAMRFIWTAEHWTCQAMAELWDRAPNREALKFCMNWYDFDRASTSRAEPFEGVVGASLFQAVRFTGTACRMEAAVATLGIARRAGFDQERLEEFEEGVRRSLALLLRTQFDPGPAHLMRPSARDYLGGFPGGSVDYRVRIDYPQHAGAALLRYYRMLEASAPDPKARAVD